jgi:hypothetical protein
MKDELLPNKSVGLALEEVVETMEEDLLNEEVVGQVVVDLDHLEESQHELDSDLLDARAFQFQLESPMVKPEEWVVTL